MTDKAKKVDREKTWELVQMKAFTSWVNSYLVKKELKVESLNNDLRDGILICEFLNIVCGDPKDKHIFKDLKLKKDGQPLMRVHAIQNVGYALKFIQEELAVRLVGVGAEDIVDGSNKLLLGLLWSLFRRLRIQTINTEDKSSEEGLLLWVKKMTDGYRGVHIDKFNNSFTDGLALLALINTYDPSFVDYDSIDVTDREGNLNKAFELAESKMGIPKLLEAADLMDGNPDERSVILYISLFFHAFVSNEDQKKRNEERERERKERERKMGELQHQLSDFADKIAQGEKEKADILKEKGHLQSDLDAINNAIKELEDKNAELLAELESFKKKTTGEKEKAQTKATFLEEKVSVLTKVVDENEDAKNDAEEKSKQLQQELDFQKQINQEMVGKQEAIIAEVSATTKKLEDEIKRRNKMKADVDELKKKVGKEIERRRDKSRAIAELQQELQALKRRAIVEGKARRGLDVLKKNLEEHLEEMYQWRELHQADLEGEKSDFNLKDVMDEIGSKAFEDQLEILNTKLQSHNLNLQRIIHLKDSHQELKDTIIKEGWLYMKASKKQKEWIKRWFVLTTSTLNYYKDEKTPQHLCSCPLVDCSLVALKAEKVEDPNFPVKKFFITKVSVLDFTIYIGFASLKEKSSWIIPLKNRVQHLTYLRALEKTHARPDTRILALFNSREIKTCNLHDNPIPVEGVEAITGVLSLQEGLEALSLVQSNLHAAEVKPLTESLSKWKLKSLNLSHNKINSEGSSGVIKSLAAAPNEFLVDLNLEDNRIDDIDCLIEALPNLPKLKNLHLKQNKIGDKGVKSLLEALKAPNAITVLHLSNNGITDTGAIEIANFLKSNSQITAVHLAHNEIGDAGADALASALVETASVEEIDLSSNKIGNKGALTFQKVAQNKVVQSVNLSSNKHIISGESLSPLLNQNGFFFPGLVFTRLN